MKERFINDSIINKAKRLYRKIVPLGIRKKVGICIFFFFNHSLYKEKRPWRLQYMSFGKLNSDKEFYILRKFPKAMGLLSCYLTYLGQLQLIAEKNYTPLVDMRTHYYSGSHNSPDDVGKINAWELYFEQLSDYDLGEVYQSKNVILGKGFTTDNAMILFNDQNITAEDITVWGTLDREYFRLVPPLRERFEETYARLIKGKRVLGVMIREGYMVLAQARDNEDPAYLTHPGIGGHPVQPSIEKILIDIADRMTMWDCNYIFISAETNYVLDAIIDAFGSKVLFTERNRRIINSLSLTEYRNSRQNFNEDMSVEQINSDYLEEVYLLSRCTCLLTGKCSGSVVAALWNSNAYEHIEFYNLGLY